MGSNRSDRRVRGGGRESVAYSDGPLRWWIDDDDVPRRLPLPVSWRSPKRSPRSTSRFDFVRPRRRCLNLRLLIKSVVFLLLLRIIIITETYDETFALTYWPRMVDVFFFFFFHRRVTRSRHRSEEILAWGGDWSIAPGHWRCTMVR